MQVECDICSRTTETFDMALHSLSDVIATTKSQGWFRVRGSCQDLCPECKEKTQKAVNA